MTSILPEAKDEGLHIDLTEAEYLRLQKALTDMGLTTADHEWDSLDMICALTVAEHEFGITIDRTKLRPRDLLDIQGLEAVIRKHGVRRPGGARLRLEVNTPPDATLHGRALERSRRQTEYRLALALPEARIAVSRGPQFTLVSCADDPTHLPIQSVVPEAIGRENKLQNAHVQHIAASSITNAAHITDMDACAAEAAGHLIEQIEKAAQSFVVHWRGVLWAPASPIISVDRLRQLGYYDAHPEQVVHLNANTALLPAACLNSYSLLDTDGDVVVGTHLATVFRNELHYNACAGRLPAFTCREILWCADTRWEETFTQDVEKFVTRLATGLGIAGDWVTASDPFFLAGEEMGRKREFRARTPNGEIAIASVNRHGDHFISRGYGHPDRVTGCVGLGLERWIVAATQPWEARS